MKVLCGISLFGHQKDYALPKLMEMLETCIRPTMDILWVTNWDFTEIGDQLPEAANDMIVRVNDMPSTKELMADQVVFVAKEIIRQFAQQHEYDALIWQGVDCYWQSAEDVKRVMGHLETCSYVGPLTSGRDIGMENYPVARRFVNGTKWQDDIPHEELEGLVPCGFPGTEACFIRSDLFHIPVMTPDYKMWFTNPEGWPPGMCVEEFWSWQVMNEEHQAYVDCDVKVWHAHDADLMARMFPGCVIPIRQLKWKDRL